MAKKKPPVDRRIMIPSLGFIKDKNGRIMEWEDPADGPMTDIDALNFQCELTENTQAQEERVRSGEEPDFGEYGEYLSPHGREQFRERQFRERFGPQSLYLKKDRHTAATVSLPSELIRWIDDIATANRWNRSATFAAIIRHFKAGHDKAEVRRQAKEAPQGQPDRPATDKKPRKSRREDEDED